MKKDLDSTHVFQNGTGQQLIDSIEDVAKRLSTIAIVKSADIDLTNYEHIQKIVQLGMAKDYFEIGDQIHTTWKPNENTEYDMPWDVVDFGPCEDPDGNIHENAMWLQSHYALSGVRFDSIEAIYAAEEEMPAGTYNFVIDFDFNAELRKGTVVQFVTTNAIAKNSLLILGRANSERITYGTSLSALRIRVMANGSETTPSEIVPLTIGNDGTNIGVLHNDSFKDNMNASYCAVSGNSNWKLSNIRQWLNSDKPAGEWWKPSTKYDTVRNTVKGFISFLPIDFAKMIKPIKITTVRTSLYPNVETDTTFDRFFLPSLREEYIDTEGKAWDCEGNVFKYWVNKLGTIQKTGAGDPREDRVRFGIFDKTGVTIWYRSCAYAYTSYLFQAYYPPSQSVILPGAIISAEPYVPAGLAPCCVIY